MANKKFLWCFFSAAIFIQLASGQSKTKYQFGKVTVQDFTLPENKIDSGADAVIISDIGSSNFEGNNRGDFTLVFTHYLRVKIITKNGFDVGNRVIYLHHDKDEGEKLSSVKGSTFNLEKGVVTETKLDAGSIYSEKYNTSTDRKKFSMPALREGSVFELEYVIKSPYDNQLRSWSFQGKYPRLWSEYVVTIPPPYHYTMRILGDQQYDIKDTKELFGSFNIKYENGAAQSEDFRISGVSTESRWVKKNVPALKEEPFITSLENYYARVSFQLNYFQWKTADYTGTRIDYLPTWNATAKTLLEHEDFGKKLNFENNWMEAEMKGLALNNISDKEKIHSIYNFVRDNFQTVDKEGYSKETIWTESSLKDVFKKREGNVAEINLLLTAMLRHEGIKADPVILSTRNNGVANASYPLLGEYNYVICIAYYDDKYILLDACQSYNGFGDLPVKCYNGYAHVVNETLPMPIDLDADSVRELSTTSVFISNDDKGKSSGTFKKVFGKSNSQEIRTEILGGSAKAYEEKIKVQNEAGLKIEHFGTDSLNSYDYPLAVHYAFDFKDFSSDIIYLNPMLGEGYKTNPFQSMDRQYPVEIPYKIDDTYIFTMEIPSGYQVDELPKSAKIALNENEGSFEYLIQKGETNIQMRVRLKLNRTFFTTEDYNWLRDFFTFVVKKENEQIVFKKIK